MKKFTYKCICAVQTCVFQSLPVDDCAPFVTNIHANFLSGSSTAYTKHLPLPMRFFFLLYIFLFQVVVFFIPFEEVCLTFLVRLV